MSVSDSELDEILTRGVAEIIEKESLRERLGSGKELRLKQGFDPSRPHLHLGSAVGLRKLSKLQSLGHQVVLVVGDWTARIGDPSERDETRPRLTSAEVRDNAQTYLEQFSRIVDLDRTEVRWQSEWYGDFDLKAVFDLAGRFTLAQMLAHETFRTRYEKGQPISLLELLYPLLQAYDSLAIEADVEFGGTDQKFNNLMGRTLQSSLGAEPQEVFLVPLIPGTDGRKMGKSFLNTIDILSPPEDMYGKIMSVADEVMPTYYETLTDVPLAELATIQSEMASAELNPRDAKMRLAREIVSQFHGSGAAEGAEAEFVRVFGEGEWPSDAPVHALEAGRTYPLGELLVEAEVVSSKSEWRRLVGQGGVRVGVDRIDDPNYTVKLKRGAILQVRIGKRRFRTLQGGAE
ncbi:MAG: tyrosine--tRNA ligase [Anaerolineae bacterium]